MKNILHVVSIMVLLPIGINAQDIKPVDVVEFSGMVFAEDQNGDPISLPYTTVAVKGTSRGTLADFEGFFSFAARPGETIVFSRVGYVTVEKKIPDTLYSHNYKWIQIMTEDNIWQPEAVIFPWPDKDHLKQDFFAIDISNELRENAAANLAQEKLEEIRYAIPADGRETSSIVLRQTANDYVYTGQTRPMQIFSPLAWKQFIDAWRRGDFKKKKNK